MSRKSKQLLINENGYLVTQLGARDVMRLSTKMLDVIGFYTDKEKEAAKVASKEGATDDQKKLSMIAYATAITRAMGSSEEWSNFIAEIIEKSTGISNFDDHFIGTRYKDIFSLFMDIYEFNTGEADKKKEEQTTSREKEASSSERKN